METGLSLGFVGFGEAGFHIAKSLGQPVAAHDIDSNTSGVGEKIRQRARETGPRRTSVRKMSMPT